MNTNSSDQHQLLTKGLISGDRIMATAELDDRVRRAATGLAELGIASGMKVALLMRNELRFIEASLAVQFLGAHAVPINWHLKPDEVLYILKDCGAKVLVAHADLLLDLDGSIPSDVTVLGVETPPDIVKLYRIAPGRNVVAPSIRSWNRLVDSHQPDRSEKADVQGTSVIYTSGTTGKPKGVVRQPVTGEQRLKSDALRRKVYGLRPGMRTAVAAPLYHFAPNSVALASARMADLLVLLPRFDPEQLLALIERERLTQLWLVPTMFIRLLKLPPEVRSRYDVSSLEFVIHAGAPCPADVKEQMIQWFGPIINELYGSTESGPVAFCTSEEWLSHRGTVGRLTEGTRVEICDDDGNVLPVGDVGEIFMWVGNYPDFTYHNSPEKRAEVSRGDLITCGDVGYLDGDDFLYICDRKRDMVITGGVNIYPAEIESAICGLDGVQDCAVFGIPDPEYGEVLMALIQPLAGAVVDPQNVLAELKVRLAAFKLPKRVEIVSELPREDSGKIFKRLLRERYWEGSNRKI